MSLTETNDARNECRANDEQELEMLPQWAFEIIRPGLRTISGALWRMKFRGTKNIPRTGGLVIAANHQTYIDPFWLSIPVKRPIRYLAWSEAFKWPVAGKMMGFLGAWPLQIERGDPTAIRRSLEWLRSGGAIVIFPEGARGNPDGTMLRFKTGAARIALEADVPILPVTIQGAHRVWSKSYRTPRFADVKISYHKPYKLTLQNGEDTRQAARRETERLAEIIGSAL